MFGMFRRRQKERQQDDNIPEITDDQSRNPFTELTLLTSHEDIVHLLMVIDKTRIVSASDDCTAIIWDCKTGKQLHTLKGHTRPITCMMVHNPPEEFTVLDDDLSSMLLLTGSSDKLICVWDVDDGQCLHTLTEHSMSIKCLVSLQEMNCFLSGGQSLCLWGANGALLSKLERSSEHSDIHTMLPIKNNRVVAASNKTLVVYSVKYSEDSSEGPSTLQIAFFRKLSSHREAIRCLVHVADSMFASASLDGAIVLWSSHSLSSTRQLNLMKNYEGNSHMYPYSVQHLFSVDQRYIFASIGHGFILYDAVSGASLAEVKNAHYGKIVHLLLLYDGYMLATCSEDGSIRLWGAPSRPVLFDGDTSILQLGTPVEKFLGRRLKDLESISKPVEPCLLGECLAHSGKVNMAVDCGCEGFASCANDDLVVLWKGPIGLHNV
ncbi:predicted protein [Nematostella vectensis]|uniref:WD repeat-containing protein 41 n=1 Tax=Nematostella vectensis TaxID=45351 RepID=A7S209_NEMVE|nr:predicted protein [Nematostella vectensis]|eukprot:XP_001634395.1 predicted protein [Nematostella vectensis]